MNVDIGGGEEQRRNCTAADHTGTMLLSRRVACRHNKCTRCCNRTSRYLTKYLCYPEDFLFSELRCKQSGLGKALLTTVHVVYGLCF